MRKLCFLTILLVVTSFAVARSPISLKVPIKNLPLITGDENVLAPVHFPPYNFAPGDGADYIGDTVKIGTTWYEVQHNGTIGRMLDKDSEGWIHVAWMNGLDYGANSRHVFYNLLDPNLNQSWPEVGMQVDGVQRAGFTTMDVYPGNYAIVAFHQTYDGATIYSALANDILPHTGSFLTYQVTPQPPPGLTNQVIWPRMQINHQGRIHFVSTESGGSHQMYGYGTFDPVNFMINYPDPNTWTVMDSIQTISADVATSEISNRVAFAWCHPRLEDDTSGYRQWNNDIYYLLDDDGVNPDFTQAINLTNFLGPDYSLLPDTLAADGDTIRAYADCNVFFDHNDNLHIAFTTHIYYHIEFVALYLAFIWHWSEEYPNQFSLVADGWSDYVNNFYSSPGAWNSTVSRPSMGESANGILYCSYQVFDTDSLTYSAAGYASGEVYIAASDDGGLTWYEGTNVTDTQSPDSALAGECKSELSPCISPTVDDYVHLFYILDRDAGFVLQTEGDWTLNNVYYHRVPVTGIQMTTLVPDTLFNTIHPGNDQMPIVKVFDLQQNYPNPFNPTTAITFSLDKMGEASLNVYNLKGEIVATVASGNYTAGAHTVTFDGSNLASGIYLYRLKTGDRTLENKMLLLK